LIQNLSKVFIHETLLFVNSDRRGSHPPLPRINHPLRRVSRGNRGGRSKSPTSQGPRATGVRRQAVQGVEPHPEILGHRLKESTVDQETGGHSRKPPEMGRCRRPPAVAAGATGDDGRRHRHPQNLPRPRLTFRMDRGKKKAHSAIQFCAFLRGKFWGQSKIPSF
jgi:hypothetical protein